jgi:hypothetical protein
MEFLSSAIFASPYTEKTYYHTFQDAIWQIGPKPTRYGIAPTCVATYRHLILPILNAAVQFSSAKTNKNLFFLLILCQQKDTGEFFFC